MQLVAMMNCYVQNQSAVAFAITCTAVRTNAMIIQMATYVSTFIVCTQCMRLQERPTEATADLEGEADIESDTDPLEFAESVRNNTTGSYPPAMHEF